MGGSDFVFDAAAKNHDKPKGSWADRQEKLHRDLFDEKNMIDLEPPIRVHGKKREIPEPDTVPVNSTANRQGRWYR